MNNYQHLLETTLSDYTQRTYILGVHSPILTLEV